MNKHYLRYLIRDRRVALIFVFVLYLSISNSVFLFSGRQPADRLSESMIIGAVMSFMMVYVLPELLLSAVHRRRSADLFLSLPISRKEMLVTSLAFAIAVPFVCFAASSLLTLVLLGAWGYAWKVILIILFMGVVITELTLINSAFFLLANNIFDGIIMICAYTGIPLLILMLVTGFIDTMVAGAYISTYPLAEQFVAYTSPLAMSVMGTGDVFSLLKHTSGITFTAMYYILPAVYALLAVYLLRKHFIERKSERAEQISDDILSYPGVIHICLFLSMLILSIDVPESGLGQFVVFYLILLFIYIVAMFVYRRSMKVGWKNLAVFGVLMALSLGFSHIAWNTKCFGLAENYTLDNEKRLTYEYHAAAAGNDLGQPGHYNSYMLNADVNFQLDIPTDDMESYREVIDLLESYRHDRIDEYYRNDDTEDSDLTQAYFAVTNHTHMANEQEWVDGIGYVYRDTESNRFGYSSSELLSEEDLKIISRYTGVEVYNYETEETEELNDFLERRNR